MVLPFTWHLFWSGQLSGSGRNTYNYRSNVVELYSQPYLKENINAHYFEVIIGRHCDMRNGMGSARCGAKRANRGTGIGHRA
jgi:hypothetical protein